MVPTYFNNTVFGVGLTVCHDPLCDDADSVVVVEGVYAKLQLDKDENPVIAYVELVNNTLNVLYCNDLYCTAPDSFTLFDYNKEEFSFQLNDMGYPVISHYVSGLHLLLTTCHNRNCTHRNTTLIEKVGSFPSLQLGKYPIITYYDLNNAWLKGAICKDQLCVDKNIVTIDYNIPGDGDFTRLDSKLQLDEEGNLLIAYRIRFLDTSGPSAVARYWLKMTTFFLDPPSLGCENATYMPTNAPSSAPTAVPTRIPSHPSMSPTSFPTSVTAHPSKGPTTDPTVYPSKLPTQEITTESTDTLATTAHPSSSPVKEEVVISGNASEEEHQSSKNSFEKILDKYATEVVITGIVIGVVIIICGVSCGICYLPFCRKKYRRHSYTNVNSHIEMRTKTMDTQS